MQQEDEPTKMQASKSPKQQQQPTKSAHVHSIQQHIHTPARTKKLPFITHQKRKKIATKTNPVRASVLLLRRFACFFPCVFFVSARSSKFKKITTTRPLQHQRHTQYRAVMSTTRKALLPQSCCVVILPPVNSNSEQRMIPPAPFHLMNESKQTDE